MGFSKTTFADMSVEFPKRYTKVEAAPYTTFTEAPGAVYEAGTSLSATLLNARDQALYDSYYGNGNTIVSTVTTNFSYSGDQVIEIQELESSVLYRKTTFSYTGDNVTSINTKIYDTDGITILREFTDAMTYSLGNISSIARTIIT